MSDDAPTQSLPKFEPPSTSQEAPTPVPSPEPRSLLADEIRAMFASFRAELKADLDKDLISVKTTVTQQADRTIASQENTRQQVVHLTKMTYSLWRNVRGSDPPPPPPTAEEVSFQEAAKDPLRQTGSQKTIKPLDDLTEEVEKTGKKVSTHDGDIAGIHGQLLVMKNSQAELLALQKEQMGKKDKGADRRSVFARIADSMIWVVKEREGQKFAATMIAGLTGLITALGTSYALMTGRLPIPTAIPPQQVGTAYVAPAPVPSTAPALPMPRPVYSGP